MSSKKDKLIDEAQKLALKGPIDKAIKAYEQLVSMDPATLSHRQRLADLLIKAGRLEDARNEFEAIGKNFSANGFNLKAIAIYTKLQGIFPDDIQITLTLAGLNEKHGLTANALVEYKRVYDYFEKSSNTEDALNILGKMQNVDPQNTSIRLKLAEALYKAGKEDESYAVFAKLASLLQERGDVAGSAKLTMRIQQLFPQKPEFMLEILSEQVAAGNAASAVAGLQALLRTNPNDKRPWDLIVKAYTQLQQPQKLKIAYQHYLKFFPDEVSAKAGFIQCLASERDVKEALALLDRYELELFTGGCLDELERIYHRLDEVDPINIKVLEGLSRVYSALGRTDELVALETKLNSLRNVSAPKVANTALTSPDPFVEPDYFSDIANEQPDSEEISFADVDAEIDLAGDQKDVSGESTPSVFDNPDDEVEVEIEFEDEIEFQDEPDMISPLDGSTTGIEPEDWLDEVGKLLDTIATQAGKVKFASSLDGADAQSHYDLGMAFMEMGLYDESFKEFRQAAADSDSDRRFACFVFQGACLREKGDLLNAEKVLQSLINTGLRRDDLCSAKYELALTYEVSGKNEDYVALLNEVNQANPSFRDVSLRLTATHNDNDFLDFSDDDLQGLNFK